MNDYWVSLKSKNIKLYESEYVFPSNDGSKPISDDKINDTIKNTFYRAFPNRKDRKVRFHELRSYKISILSNVGINEWHTKRMVGKSISKDMSGYLKGIDLKSDFKKIYPQIKFMGLSTENHQNLRGLETTIAKQHQRITELETTIKVLDKKIDLLDGLYHDYQDRFGTLLMEKIKSTKKPKK